MSDGRDERDRDPLEGASSEDVDARFAAIIAGLTSDNSWTASTSQSDDPAAAMATGPRLGPTVVDPPADPVSRDTASAGSGRDDAAERARRRELRKAERAEEVAAFEAERQRVESEIESDEEHFVPPEPPPLPRPRRRTVVALLLMALGLVFLARPEMLQVAPDVVIVLGVLLLLGGFSLLLAGLRRRSADPGDGDGWDDGARL